MNSGHRKCRDLIVAERFKRLRVMSDASCFYAAEAGRLQVQRISWDKELALTG